MSVALAVIVIVPTFVATKLTVGPDPMLVPSESFHSIDWEMSLSSEPVAFAVRLIVDP